jgi:hypothetical protein
MPDASFMRSRRDSASLPLLQRFQHALIASVKASV